MKPGNTPKYATAARRKIEANIIRGTQRLTRLHCQIPRGAMSIHVEHWNLVLGTSLVLGPWNLELSRMPDSIKKQIMDRIASDLAPLKPATFRDITRENDSTRDSKALPALMIYDGPETTVSKTTTQ